MPIIKELWVVHDVHPDLLISNTGRIMDCPIRRERKSNRAQKVQLRIGGQLQWLSAVFQEQSGRRWVATPVVRPITPPAPKRRSVYVEQEYPNPTADLVKQTLEHCTEEELYDRINSAVVMGGQTVPHVLMNWYRTFKKMHGL